MKRFFAFTLMISLTAACSGEFEASSTGAKTTGKKTEIDYIYERMATYLPYEYLDRGDCWARAPYVGMELAISGIPSLPTIISACAQTTDETDKLLQASTGNEWIYHTAPMILIDGKPKVIDPSLSLAPIDHQQWLNMVNSTARPYYTLVNQRAQYTIGYGDPALCGERASLPSQIDELPVFQEINIPGNCGYMWSNIEKLNGRSISQKDQMKNALVNRTVFLWEKLKEMNLLDENRLTREQIINQCSTGIPET